MSSHSNNTINAALTISNFLIWPADSSSQGSMGKAFVGPEKARFIDAFWIILLGNVIGGIFNTVFSAIFSGFSASIIGFIIQLLIWIGLVKHFFDTSCGKALVIAIVAFIVTLVIFAILAAILISIGRLSGWTWI